MSPDLSTSTACQQFVDNRMSRKYLPYTPDPPPLEIRYVSQFMGRGYQPDFTAEAINNVRHVCCHVFLFCAKNVFKKFEEQLENGLSRMKTTTLYKGYKAKLLACEVGRQRLSLATLEVEEASLTVIYADAICAENQEHFGFAEEELQCYRGHFSKRGRLEADKDRDYLQAVYEDECEILRTVSIQTNQVAKILDKRIVQSLKNSTTFSPLHRHFRNGVHITAPFAHEDSDVMSDGSDDMKDELRLSDLGSDE